MGGIPRGQGRFGSAVDADELVLPMPPAPTVIPPTGAEIWANIEQVAAHLGDAPPPLVEPVKLTRSQMDALRPRNEVWSPPSGVVPSLAPLLGVPVVEVETVEESTPYLLGWLT